MMATMVVVAIDVADDPPRANKSFAAASPLTLVMVAVK